MLTKTRTRPDFGLLEKAIQTGDKEAAKALRDQCMTELADTRVTLVGLISKKNSYESQRGHAIQSYAELAVRKANSVNLTEIEMKMLRTSEQIVKDYTELLKDITETAKSLHEYNLTMVKIVSEIDDWIAS